MLELLTPEQMARVDRLAAGSGSAPVMLMENAGRAVARAVRARIRPCRTLVLCGPGNNGGDGYVAARLLAQAGWPVSVAALAPPRDGSDAAVVAARWRGPRRDFSPATASNAALVIDAVFGAGLSRDVDGVAAETLRAAGRIVAVDVPSGIDGGTGAVRGYAPQAAFTVTFFRRKPGHLLLPGRDRCGELVVADIGIPASLLEQVGSKTFANGPALWRRQPAGADENKYTRGTVTVCGGAAMTGAARLAAGAARRGGAGLVSIAAEHGAAIYRSGAPGLIVLDAPLASLLEDKRRRVWVCGPGLGQDEARRVLPALVAAGRSIVADADALTAFAGNPQALAGASVLTPHAGEFARVFGDPGHDRLGACRAAARTTGAVVVLKGSDTIIAAPDGRANINDNAPRWLATAGSGDVLAGLAAAGLALGYPPFEAACRAVWLHGEAGNIAGEGLIAEDLLQAVKQALIKMPAA
jgi:hydroxyethylthiazole kinase-like uncharacterized protein yjeF